MRVLVRTMVGLVLGSLLGRVVVWLNQVLQMDLMAMRQEPDGTVIVDTGQIVLRSSYTLDQAVRLSV